MTLIENWTQSWRFSSVQAAAMLVGLNVLQQALPLFGFAMPANVLSTATMVLGLAVIVARTIAQPGVLASDEAPGSILIANWPQAWRFTSVQMASALVVLNLLQEQVLTLIGTALPPTVLPWVNAVLGLAVIVARNITQPGVTGSSEALQ